MVRPEHAVTIVESRRAQFAGELPAEISPRSPVETPSVLDTIELRWFMPGPLPSDVRRWFTGSTGVDEDRCDTYLLDGRVDTGIKRRFRQTLELKVRLSVAERIELADGVAGSLEVWRRWSPAVGLVEDRVDGRWVDVHKSIVKRRFSVDGTEIAFSPNPTGTGCDVEVAAVSVDKIQGWTFAFAAFGPPVTRREALAAAWQALMTDAPDAAPLGLGRAMGYPEWLALTTSTSRTAA